MPRSLFPLLIASLALLGACTSQQPAIRRAEPPAPIVQPGLLDGYYQVWRVVDGDTIILANVGPLRLTDVNALEINTPEGQAAKAALVVRIPAGTVIHVEFVRRKKASSQGDAGTVVRDRWGRFLGKIRGPPL